MSCHASDALYQSSLQKSHFYHIWDVKQAKPLNRNLYEMPCKVQYMAMDWTCWAIFASESECLPDWRLVIDFKLRSTLLPLAVLVPIQLFAFVLHETLMHDSRLEQNKLQHKQLLNIATQGAPGKSTDQFL